MPEVTEKPKSAVSLDQLLQLKRAERPTPDFWNEFDRELRRRQLASLVSVRPWYERLGLAATLFLKRAAPVGVAAAALTAGIVSVNSSNESAGEPIYAASSPAEPTFVLLPEERIDSDAYVAATDSNFQTHWGREQPANSRSHYAIKELGVANAPGRPFVTISEPVTFSAPREATDVYLVNTLTSGPALESAGTAEATSF